MKAQLKDLPSAMAFANNLVDSNILRRPSENTKSSKAKGRSLLEKMEKKKDKCKKKRRGNNAFSFTKGLNSYK